MCARTSHAVVEAILATTAAPAHHPAARQTPGDPGRLGRPRLAGRLARTGLAACWARGPRLIRQSWPRQRPCRTCRDLLCPREMRRRRTQVRRKRVNFGLPRIGTGGQANAGRGAELIHGTPDFGSQRPNGSRQRCVQSLVCIAHLLTSRLGTGDIARADSALRTLHSTLNVLARVRSLCRPSRYRARFLRRPHRALR